MAKVKTTDTGTTVLAPDTISESTDEGLTPQAASTSEHLPDKRIETTPTKAGAELPSVVAKILKAFRAYAQLYVDPQGSPYAPDTPERLRPGAVLYKNPFYEP